MTLTSMGPVEAEARRCIDHRARKREDRRLVDNVEDRTVLTGGEAADIELVELTHCTPMKGAYLSPICIAMADEVCCVFATHTRNHLGP